MYRTLHNFTNSSYLLVVVYLLGYNYQMLGVDSLQVQILLRMCLLSG